MESLKQMLEDYRNGKLGLPTYEELLNLVSPQVVADEMAAFSDWLATMPKPVQENVKTSMARGESYTYKAFCAGHARMAPAPTRFGCEFKAVGATFIGNGAANPITYVTGGACVDLSGWTCYAPGIAPVQFGAVPDEPTEAMLIAGGRDDSHCSTCGYDNGGGDPGATYRAMRAAVKEPTC